MEMDKRLAVPVERKR